MRERDAPSSPRNWFRRRSQPLVIIWVALLISGIVLIALGSLTETSFRERRTFQGTVPPLAEGGAAQAVPEAIYEGLGLAEARAPELECGVAVHFLTAAQAQEFQTSGRLPIPQLHCERIVAILPGSVADVRVENQRANASAWHFELTLFEVSSPRSFLFLPAAVLLLVGGLGLTVSVFQWAVGRWLEGS